MQEKRVLNQTQKSQRLKARHRLLISRQNLLRQKRNRKKLKSLKFPNKTLHLLTTTSQILKYSMVRHLPFFHMRFFFYSVHCFHCLCFIHTGKSKESSHFDPNRQAHGPKHKVLTCFESSSFHCYRNISLVWFSCARSLIFNQLWFSEKPKRTEEKQCGRQEHVLFTHQIWQVTHKHS